MSTVTSVYKNVRGLRTAIKDVGRMRQIITILVRHGFGALVHRMQLFELFGIKQVEAGDAGSQDTFARRLRVAFEALGPTFVKLGQILSTRADLVGEELAAELQRLQDQTSPMPWEEARAAIEAELGRPVDVAFATIEDQPLASASVAQVHCAVLEDGTEVVVKIQRPGIRAGIHADLSILHFLAARAAALVPELSLIDPVGIVASFERAMNRELDFGYERGHLELFRENFDGFDGIHIPQVYPALCTSSVITMERIRGVKVTEAVERLGVDPYELAPVMLRALFKMVLQDGIFHGDLHPGNILVREDHTIALIDFGLVGRMLQRQREAILDLLIGLATQDHEMVARCVYDIAVKVPGVAYDYVAFENDVVDLLEQFAGGKRLARIDMQAVFGELVNGALRHRMKMPAAYTMVFKALITVEGIGRALAPELDPLAEAKPFIEKLVLERYNPQRLLRQTVQGLTSAGHLLRAVAQTTPRLLRDLEEGRFALRVESEQLQALAGERRRATTSLVRSIVFGASAVAGTLALEAPGQQLLGVSLLSFVFYAIGAVVAVPLVFKLLTRW